MGLRASQKLSQFGESHPPNLIPLMNLFLILIPMLITMVVTVKLTLMNLNLPSGTKTVGKVKEKVKKFKKLDNLIVVLTKDKDILLLGYSEGITPDNLFLMGKGDNAIKAIRIPKEKYRFSFRDLEKYIIAIKKNYPKQRSINFACDDVVIYENLIKTMDLCRRNGLPEVGILEIKTIGFRVRS